MGDKSAIQWTQATWNVLLGCSKLSSGCQNCYAVGHIHRMAGNPNAKVRAANEGLTLRHRNGQLDWSGKLRFLPKRLDQPAQWSRPRMIFVNSLSDLFHDDIEMRHLAAIWSVMALTPHHTYQILTKRPENILPMLSQPRFLPAFQMQAGYTARENRLPERTLEDPVTHPLPNVWLGTSVEDQAAADKRIPHLEKAPAAVHFLSCEPLLGRIDLRAWLPTWPDGQIIHKPTLWGSALSWVIAGGESGPHARPMHPEWVHTLRNQCFDGGIPFFFKQWGEWTPDLPFDQDVRATALMHRDGRYFVTGQTNVVPTWVEQRVGCGADPDVYMYRVGKHVAGRLLDGREWNEMPT